MQTHNGVLKFPYTFDKFAAKSDVFEINADQVCKPLCESKTLSLVCENPGLETVLWREGVSPWSCLKTLSTQTRSDDFCLKSVATADGDKILKSRRALSDVRTFMWREWDPWAFATSVTCFQPQCTPRFLFLSPAHWLYIKPGTSFPAYHSGAEILFLIRDAP